MALPLNYYNTGVTLELDTLLQNGVKPWNFDYPSWYEGEAKTAFEQKVLDHYRFHQIGQETVGRWLHYFRTKIREIMPYYIQLYKSEALLYEQEDMLESYHLVEEFSMERTNTDSYEGSSSSDRNADNDHRFSNTPQGELENLNKYLTEASKDSGSETVVGSNEGSSDSSGTVKTTMTRRGNIGVQPLGDELQKLRAAFLNIDQMIIDELRDLFLLVY